MHVLKVDDGFRFSFPTATELFDVHMTLRDDGAEELQTVVRKMDLNLPVARLESGSVAGLLGPDHWNAFLRLRSSGYEEMLL